MVKLGFVAKLPEDVVFFRQARQGLFFLASDLIKQQPTRVFIIPSYTCPTVPKAIEQAGGRCIYVDLSDDLDIDLVDLQEVTRGISEEDWVILATQLFGAPIRDYKQLYPNAIVIEDRCQGLYAKESNANYQLLSFGAGKMISISGGGALVGLNLSANEISCLSKQGYINGFIQFAMTYMQKVVLENRIIYFMMSPVITYLIKSRFDDGPIAIELLNPILARWAWWGVLRGHHGKRSDCADRWMSALSEMKDFNVKSGIPLLRLPIARRFSLGAMFDGASYAETVEKAELSRGKNFKIANKLQNSTLLPCHPGVTSRYMQCVLGDISNSLG